MATVRLKLAIGKTINLGNYESLRLDVGIEHDLVDGQSIDTQMDALHSECRKQLAKEEQRMMRELGELG